MEDNARKFIIDRIDAGFLTQHKAASFLLTVDWIITEEDSEKKLVYKKFESGEIQLLLVSKITDSNGSRHADKKKISEEEYRKLLPSAATYLEKKRYEFNFLQNNITFALKYDEFKDGALCILEVDAENEAERKLFDPAKFPYPLSEITGDMKYYGYRITEII